MILESVFNLFKSAIKLIFAWINIPAAPPEVTSVIDTMITYMRSGIGFLFLFFNMDLVKIMIPFVLIVANFEEVYKLVMFVLRKIPFLGIE
mgnify:FL=1